MLEVTEGEQAEEREEVSDGRLASGSCCTRLAWCLAIQRLQLTAVSSAVVAPACLLLSPSLCSQGQLTAGRARAFSADPPPSRLMLGRWVYCDVLLARRSRPDCRFEFVCARSFLMSPWLGASSTSCVSDRWLESVQKVSDGQCPNT